MRVGIDHRCMGLLYNNFFHHDGLLIKEKIVGHCVTNKLNRLTHG
jgi:hypothetical protein